MRLIVLTLAVVCLACAETEDENFDLGLDYYPLVSNEYRTYDVTEIRYEISGFDTLVYQLRETLLSDSGSSDNYYPLLRETRADSMESWSVDSLWNVRYDGTNLIVAENNRSLVKLVFPVKDGQSWNLNAFNSSASQVVSMETAQVSELLGNYVDLGLNSDLIRVWIHDVPANLVNQYQEYEVYARGIGLLEKSIVQLQFCTDNSCDEVGQIQSGVKRVQTLTAYGSL